MQAGGRIVRQTADQRQNLVGHRGTIGGGANVVYEYPDHIGKHMDVMGVEGDGGGIEVILAAEGIEAAIIWGEKIGQNPLPAGLCGQDVDLGDGHRWVTNLGEIVQRLSDHLRRKTRDRHEDLSPCIHPRCPFLRMVAVVAGVSSQYSEVVWVLKSSRSCTNRSGHSLLSVRRFQTCAVSRNLACCPHVYITSDKIRTHDLP